MLPSLELFSLMVKEGLAALVNRIDLLSGGMPLFPTSNYSKSLLEPTSNYSKSLPEPTSNYFQGQRATLHLLTPDL